MTVQLSLGYIDPLDEAIRWKRANPRAYEELLELANRDIANGARPSIGLYAEILRRPHFATMLGLRRTDEAYLLNNNLRAELARLLEREHGIEFPKRHARSDEIEVAS